MATSKKNPDLAKLQSVWKKAQPKEGFEQIPDGDYNAKIEKAFIDKNDKTGKLSVVFQMKVAGGEQNGREFRKYSNIDTPENLEWLKGDLVRLDVEPPDEITDLPDVLDGLEGTFVSVRVKTKNEYPNYYFNGVISADDVDEDGGEEEVDFDALDKDELLEYIKENGLEIEGAKKMKEKELREAVKEAAAGSAEEEEETEEEEEQEEPDFNSMDKDDLIAFIKENELEVEGYKKLDEKKLRKAVSSAWEAKFSEESEETEEEGEEVDLDEMDKEELLAFIKDNELTIKNAKAMKEKELRKAIEKALAD